MTEQHVMAEHTLVVEREPEAPRELVWTLWTDPDEVTRWWGRSKADGAAGAGRALTVRDRTGPHTAGRYGVALAAWATLMPRT
jgi:uncharacterized protein YndB with AHSA1/START domain